MVGERTPALADDLGWRPRVVGIALERYRRVGAFLAGLVLAATLLSGCESAPATPKLDGTSWKLVTIESMDDEQGTTTVDDPSQYTVKFGTDGQAALQIDCNTATSTFEASPSGTDGSGTLTFGPIATTLMGCPQPSLDQQVSTLLPFVRSYLISDGKLHMTLEADGAILTWESHDVSN